MTDTVEQLAEAIASHTTAGERNEAISKLVDLLEDECDDFKPDGPGRPLSARGQAREIAAGMTGLQPESVRKMEARAADYEPVAFRTFGMELNEGFLDQMEEADRAVTSEEGRLTRVIAYCQVHNKKSLRGLKSARDRIRSLRPVGLCPYCKGQRGVQGSCKPCRKRGWVDAAVMGKAPERFMLEEPMVVMLADGTEREVE